MVHKGVLRVFFCASTPILTNFFWLHPNHPCFERPIRKMRRYTNVVCCSMNIEHSGLFLGSSAVLVLLGANADCYTVRSFFPLFFLYFFSLSFGWCLFCLLEEWHAPLIVGGKNNYASTLPRFALAP